ncbi:MAG: MipA/OmpV family protein [Burkholderiales bacterium]
MRVASVALGVGVLSMLLPAHAIAQTAPLWEAGVGAGVIDFPHYRGSDQRETLALPFPYFIYRGEHLQVDRQGVRGLLLSTDRVEFDISMNATPPVESEKNLARQGMSDLNPTVEIGPSLNFNLMKSERFEFELRLPLRLSIATDFTRAQNAGWVFQPSLAWDSRELDSWKVGFLGGFIFGDRRQHQYFYGVAPRFSTALRPAYQAGAGYAGAYLLGSVNRRSGPYWFGGFVRADTLSGAVFEDSPLVRASHAVYAGVAFAWVFAESAQRVTDH